MLDKILDFLEQYLNNIDLAVKKSGKLITISCALNVLIERQSFTKEELRKELSLYLKRIIHIQEFENLLDKDAIEYQRIIYEV